MPTLVPYSIAASATLLTYDTLCTLRYEVTYVWFQPFSLGTILFFLNRYLPFIDTLLSLDLLAGNTPKTPQECLIRFKVVTWFIVIGTLIAELTLMLRTYAIWGRTRSIFIILSVVFALVCIPSVVVTQLEIDSLVYGPWDRGCKLVKASPVIFVAYVLLMLSESIIAGLTFYKAAKQQYIWSRSAQIRTSTHSTVEPPRVLSSTWINRMFRDGLVFYLYLLVISLANVIVPVTAPSRYSNWLATPQRVIHSVLCSRVLLCLLIARHPHRPVHFSSHDTTGMMGATTGTHLSFATTPPQFTHSDHDERDSDDDEEEEIELDFVPSRDH